MKRELFEDWLVNKTRPTDDFYDFILRADTRDAELQSLLMTHWWKSQMPRMISEYPQLITKLDWENLIECHGYNFLNDRNNNKRYEGQKISWFHYGLLEHWRIIEKAQGRVELKSAINIRSSLGENSWHLFARALAHGPVRDYSHILALITQHCLSPLNEPDGTGETALGIIKAHIEMYGQKNEAYDIQMNWLRYS